MSFKKSLISAQACLEYIILFTIVVILTLLSFTDFLPQIQRAMQGEGGFFQVGAERIIEQGYYQPAQLPPQPLQPPEEINSEISSYY